MLVEKRIQKCYRRRGREGETERGGSRQRGIRLWVGEGRKHK